MEHTRALDILKKDYNFTVITTGHHYYAVCWENAIVMWYEVSSVIENIHKIRHISAFKKNTYKNLVNYDYSLVHLLLKKWMKIFSELNVIRYWKRSRNGKVKI